MTTILLADGQPIVLTGLAALLQHRFEVVGATTTGNLLVEAAERLKPDIIVLEVNLPILNGIDAARQIKRNRPSTKLIFLTAHNNSVVLRRALEVGASGYVLKSAAPEELLAGLRAVTQGKIYISPNVGEDARRTACDPSHNGYGSPAQITVRQRQVLQLVAEGKQNKEIASLLHVSIKTVDFHRGRLMARLGVCSVANLTRIALQEGLFDDDGEQQRVDNRPAA